MNKSFVRQALPVLLTIGLLWYVLKDVPLTELAAQFRLADYRWLALTGLLIGVYHLVKAARWQLTLQALGYQPTLFRTTVALLAGSLASMLVPGAGEITRCGTLQRTDGVPLAQGIGSVVAERVVDIFMLLLIIGLTVLLEFRRVGQYLVELLSPVVHRFSPNGQSNTLLIGLTIGFLTIVVLLYWLLRSPAFWQHRLIIRLTTIAGEIKRGFLSIQQLKRPWLFIFLTILSYGLIFLTTYTLFFASPRTVTLPPQAALTILTVSSIGGIAVPTQGGLGTYHFLVSRALVLYGMTLTEGVIVATFLHAVQTGFALLLSSLSFLIIPLLITNRQKKQESNLVK
ncbi:flippase-like domain-containing protein [Spirosoma sp. KCTC 42546]|uniref:lysylphosphatidylglycerol synthase transmembrane domain-containing protein n=1 Tax=Spirosoma sp. KCTC 42546 TaxID=2520506 RepID=UPI00115B132D|nr:lysylphosphatidylglycerol synthase transmembrane domain-containing protein [Spirosoma sp. KCTC 42546]QDK77222.1 flippase-like domain-containing protein [Spirosoma sp. KCTC 42546]